MVHTSVFGTEVDVDTACTAAEQDWPSVAAEMRGSGERWGAPPPWYQRELFGFQLSYSVQVRLGKLRSLRKAARRVARAASLSLDHAVDALNATAVFLEKGQAYHGRDFVAPRKRGPYGYHPSAYDIPVPDLRPHED